MKKISLIMIALLAVLSFSCGLLDKADVSFDATLPLDFTPITETAVSNTPVSYTYTKLLDATQNAEIAKYKDKIKDFKVNKVYFEITDSQTPDVTFSNGILKVHTTGKTIVTVPSQTVANTTKKELTGVDTAGLNELAELLKKDKQATVALAGTFSKTPALFKVRAYFDVTITASPLK